MNRLELSNIKEIWKALSLTMARNKDYLVELDSKMGDGDLGISMSSGFSAVAESAAMQEESIQGFLKKAAMVFNEASPSSMGTILFMGIWAGARQLGDPKSLSLRDIGIFFKAAADKVMDKTGSKEGEKTILDAVVPAARVLLEWPEEDDLANGMEKAYEAAREGMLATRQMKGFHGRAAYYGEKAIGKQDGGATVGMLVFQTLYEYVRNH